MSAAVSYEPSVITISAQHEVRGVRLSADYCSRSPNADSFTPSPPSPILTGPMRITILPQRKELEIAGRRRAADVLRELGFLPGTAMVIRADVLVSESSMLEADDVIEIRSVISGGA